MDIHVRISITLLLVIAKNIRNNLKLNRRLDKLRSAHTRGYYTVIKRRELDSTCEQRSQKHAEWKNMLSKVTHIMIPFM